MTAVTTLLNTAIDVAFTALPVAKQRQCKRIGINHLEIYSHEVAN